MSAILTDSSIHLSLFVVNGYNNVDIFHKTLAYQNKTLTLLLKSPIRINMMF